MALAAEKTFAVEGIGVPDSRLARQITELVRDTESAMLFYHSSRVYYWGALAGKRCSLKFDRELLYAGAMFHDMGLRTAAPISASKSTAQTPLVISSATAALRSTTSIWSGPRSLCTRRLASRSTCLPSSRW
jgi:hypothetical protein